MALVANKRSVMTLFSDPVCIHSQRVRIVLAEKGVNVEIIDVNPADKPQELGELNPYNQVPTLVDRELVIYTSGIIMEYLDERFPHPPLMPVYPVARAETRRTIYRLDHDLYRLYHQIQSGNKEEQQQARDRLRDAFTALSPAFASNPFFLSEEFTLIDCCLAPLIWRLPSLGIELPKQAKAVEEYAEQIFDRDSFQESLTEAERELREDLTVSGNK